MHLSCSVFDVLGWSRLSKGFSMGRNGASRLPAHPEVFRMTLDQVSQVRKLVNTIKEAFFDAGIPHIAYLVHTISFKCIRENKRYQLQISFVEGLCQPDSISQIMYRTF